MIRCDSDGVTIDGKHIRFEEFPDYVRSHLARVPRTLEIEAMGRELIARGFQPPDIADFVRAVCNWGGYAGIAGRVLRDNPPTELAASFRGAVGDLGSGVEVAVKRLLAVRQLGVSFASKHLRFLAPRVCAILDSKVAAQVCAILDSKMAARVCAILDSKVTARVELRSCAHGVAQYSALCSGLAEELEARHTPNPMMRPKGSWFAADVDMVLFAAMSAWESGRRGLTRG